MRRLLSLLPQATAPQSRSWMRRHHRSARSRIKPLAATCRLSAVLILCAVCTGCPELNRWAGPNHDPFFSVEDEPRPNTEQAKMKMAREEDPSADLGSWQPIDTAAIGPAETELTDSDRTARPDAPAANRLRR